MASEMTVNDLLPIVAVNVPASYARKIETDAAWNARRLGYSDEDWRAARLAGGFGRALLMALDPEGEQFPNA